MVFGTMKILYGRKSHELMTWVFHGCSMEIRLWKSHVFSTKFPWPKCMDWPSKTHGIRVPWPFCRSVGLSVSVCPLVTNVHCETARLDRDAVWVLDYNWLKSSTINRLINRQKSQSSFAIGCISLSILNLLKEWMIEWVEIDLGVTWLTVAGVGLWRCLFIIVVCLWCGGDVIYEQCAVRCTNPETRRQTQQTRHSQLVHGPLHLLQQRLKGLSHRAPHGTASGDAWPRVVRLRMPVTKNLQSI